MERGNEVDEVLQDLPHSAPSLWRRVCSPWKPQVGVRELVCVFVGGWIPTAAASFFSLPFPALIGSLPKWVVNKSSQFLAPKVSDPGTWRVWRLGRRAFWDAGMESGNGSQGAGPGLRGGVTKPELESDPGNSGLSRWRAWEQTE